jgi:tungstate transport system substrate-binding protein
MKLRNFFAVVFVALLGHPSIGAEPSSPQSIILASTTSVENSGLLKAILPAFTKETGITVHVQQFLRGQIFGAFYTKGLSRLFS